MSWRLRRQLGIAIIFLSIFFGIGFYFIYPLFPKPTCFDNIQNQNELGVDCGGPCIPCALKNPQPIVAFWTRSVPVRPGLYDVAAFVQNPNEVLSSAHLEYVIELSDELGVVGTAEGSTFIHAQERMLIVATNVAAIREPKRVFFIVKNAGWEFRREPRPNIVVERQEYKVRESFGSAESIVEARIRNDTPYHFREIEVLFAVFDRGGNLIGTNRIVRERVMSGASVVVTSIWPKALEGEIGEVRVEPRANIFDPSIILKP